jgi:hypothetical protein
MGSNRKAENGVRKMSHGKVNFVLSFVALAALSGPAQAGFIWIDEVSPDGSPPADVSTTNDFRAQLAGSGISQLWLGRSLGIVGAGLGDWVSAEFFAAEAGYRNQFWANGSLLVDNQGNQSWSARPKGSFNVSDGILDFGFCAVTINSCLSNSANDGTTAGSFQSIGMGITDSNTAWLLWDDSGANVDDDYDDLVVRLTYHGTARSVPEPGTCILFALGLLGMTLLSRRKIAISAL